MSKKLKVVLICNFSNEEVRQMLPLSKMRISNFLRLLTGKNKFNYHDFAPWVTNLIREFEHFQDVELHIISPFTGLKYFSYEFELNGVFYHFYQPNLPILHFPIHNNIFKNGHFSFIYPKWFVNKTLSKIRPDIVNLIGTENPDYSITTLGIKNIPVFVSVQTVYTNPARKKYSDSCLKFTWELELKIHQKEKYFGCGGRIYHDLILKNNSKAIIFKNFFPKQKLKKIRDVPKEYDFVFFAAGITKKKGIEDAIDALALVKKKKSDITLNVVGGYKIDYKKILDSKIEKLNLTENISFTGFFDVHADMLQHVKKGRFALLPIKLDVIPGTVTEAMLLEIPVITYKTTGTPYLNKDGETVLLSTIGDINELTNNMFKLINNPELSVKLAKEAKAFVEKEFNGTNSAMRLVSNYKSVIEHYHNNTPIPEEQLFSISEFPLY